VEVGLKDVELAGAGSRAGLTDVLRLDNAERGQAEEKKKTDGAEEGVYNHAGQRIRSFGGES
jgi:hypothetical protein